MQAHCAQEGSADGPWLNLTQGFLVPIDEIIDSSPVFSGEAETSDGGRRADFIHVQTDPRRGPLEFRFVEVKHRLHLRTARQPELLASMLLQTAQLRRRWTDWYFGLELNLRSGPCAARNWFGRWISTLTAQRGTDLSRKRTSASAPKSTSLS